MMQLPEKNRDIAPLDYYPPLGGVSLPPPPLPAPLTSEHSGQSAEEEEIALMVNAQLRMVEAELRRTDEEVRRATQLRWQHEEAELKRVRERATQAALESTRRAEAELKEAIDAARAGRVAAEAKKRVDEDQRRRAERSHRAQERAARVADAWYPIGTNAQHMLDTRPRLEAGIARLRKLTADAGRDPNAMGVVYRIKRHGFAAPPASDGNRRLFTGSIEAVIDDIHALKAMGVTAMDFDFEGREAAVAMAEMRKFRDEVLAKI